MFVLNASINSLWLAEHEICRHPAILPVVEEADLNLVFSFMSASAGTVFEAPTHTLC